MTHGFSSCIEFCEVKRLGRAELTSGYIVVPRTTTSVSPVCVSTWALRMAWKARLGETTIGHFAITEGSAMRAAKGEGFR